MTAPDTESLDRATISLIFALRDSLTDASPSRLDFWEIRAKTAIEAAAAGSATAAEAVSAACRKLQIDTLTKDASARVVTGVTPTIDADYPAWAAHVARTITYIVALARVENDETKTAKAAARAAAHTNTDQEEAMF